jgi:tubulin-folding cofactor B
MTVLRVKEKLQSHVGSSVGAMRLTLRDASGAPVAALEDDAKPLGFYSPRDGFSLHVVDTDAGSASAAGWLEDVSKVQKFELSEEAYDARGDTFRKFAAQQRQADPSWTLQKELARRRGVRALACARGARCGRGSAGLRCADA